MEKQVIFCDVAVIGSGPAGMLAALELARKVNKVILIGPDNLGAETRTTALMMPSINFIKNLCSWETIENFAAPLKTMRIIDGTKRLIRSPTVEFSAHEIGEDAFGYNIPNKRLNSELANAVKNNAKIEHITEFAKHYEITNNHVKISLSSQQQIETKLVIAADGRNSIARKAAGIDVCQWSYPQTAITTTFKHEFPHNFISTEFHTEHGPFTQVPLPGNRSALVWTVAPEKAQYLLSLGAKALNQEIAKRMHFLLGSVEVEELPESWPMGGMTAKRFAANRIALIGETAHLFPPIGAQGLNLTMRDVKALGEAVTKAKSDIGSSMVLEDYHMHRRGDVKFRTNAVHGLNRALLSNFLPVQLIRSSGLELLRQHALLRNLFMREGMTPKAGFHKLLPPFMK